MSKKQQIETCIITFYTKGNDNYNLEGSIVITDKTDIQKIATMCQSISKNLSNYQYNNVTYKNTPFINVFSEKEEEQSFIKLVNTFCLAEGITMLLYDGFIISVPQNLI